MFEKNLESIAGIGIYPMFSLLVFFAFFTLLLIYLAKADKQHLEELSKMPLNSTNELNK